MACPDNLHLRSFIMWSTGIIPDSKQVDVVLLLKIRHCADIMYQQLCCNSSCLQIDYEIVLLGIL